MGGVRWLCYVPAGLRVGGSGWWGGWACGVGALGLWGRPFHSLVPKLLLRKENYSFYSCCPFLCNAVLQSQSSTS